MIELLSPVGDFECLKAAVQNGANAVYFGANTFSARSFATNFDIEELEQAINYAKLRGVKTHLTLNTLIKNNEFNDALFLAQKAYEFGIDAIIVQDLGLAIKLIDLFPDLDIHASTQMTTTNLAGIKMLESFGFKRAVLSREVSLSEIKNICKHSQIEIETFIHGALCISYSGQCLFSSMVGGRSGNRGQCAQPCRLPYTLIDKDSNILDNGYLLSTKDLCTLENLPELIQSGVTSFKIEGRMKSPTYVATVTKIYRKYIDLAIKFSNNEIENYLIDDSDKIDLLQVFNRGNFSSGHLSDEPNKNLVFKHKPNNMGIYLGKILKYNKNKGLITLKLENELCLGDSISFENENSKYTISELLEKNTNIKIGQKSQIVTIGRMKGNINLNDRIYKINSKELSTNALNSYNKEFKKTLINCKLNIQNNKNINVEVTSVDFNLKHSFCYNFVPNIAKNAPITEENIIKQFKKTQNTCFEFSDITICLEDNLFIPTSILNDIRRETISHIENLIIKNFKRKSQISQDNYLDLNINLSNPKRRQISLLLNNLNASFNYENLNTVDKLYIPLKYFINKDFEKIINILSKKCKLYIYMPIIIKDKFVKHITDILDKTFNKFNIYGIVISNISQLNILSNIQLPKNIDLIANYTFNVFNSYTIQKLTDLGFSTITTSPELDIESINNICTFSKNIEVISYSQIPLMTMSYCLLGKSNKCYQDCKHKCLSFNNFYIKDRYGFKFKIIPDNLQTLTTIYNSRITNLDCSNLDIASVRIDILDESIEEINNIIKAQQ